MVVPSSFKLSAWDILLSDYTDNIVVTFLRYGFPLDYQSLVLPPQDSLRNHAGATKHAQFINNYLASECSNSRIAGPFDKLPLPNFVVSPLNSVPKTDSTERRVLADLSWPIGNSINSGIESSSYLGETFQLHYPTLDDISDLVILKGRGCLIYKRDLKQAYRQLPTDPADYNLSGYFWEGQYYFDTVLAMGRRNAAMACQRVTQAVGYIHAARGYSVVPYLDDFMGVEGISSALAGFNALSDLLLDLGLIGNLKKACYPSSKQVCLGILINTNEFTLSIDSERLTEILDLIEFWLTLDWATKKQLQSLVGKLVFVSKCVRQSRIFLNRILLLLRQLNENFHRIKLDVAFKKDLLWWKRFVRQYNGVSLIPHVSISAPDAVFAVDACLTGCGGVFGNQYFHAQFPKHIIAISDNNINFLELLTLTIAVKLWGKSLEGLSIQVFCDNSSAVTVLNSGKTRSVLLNDCLRELFFYLAKFQVSVFGVNISGVDNRLPDLLSRWEVGQNSTIFLSRFGRGGICLSLSEAIFSFENDL